MKPNPLTLTSDSKVTAIARLLAALPLLLIGLQHLTGAAPMLPILKGADIPFPELGALLAPNMKWWLASFSPSDSSRASGR